MGKQKIVIVGAGPAGLSAAFHLTDPATNPDWQSRYDVDVYQLGWRVGGKCATGRNPDACERIQEHGIHLLGNLYFNTLRMLRGCFAEVVWDENDQHRTMADAFTPSLIAYDTDYFDGRWHGLVGHLPANDEVPWEGSAWPDARGVLENVLSLVDRRLAQVLEGPGESSGGVLHHLLQDLERAAGDDVRRVVSRLAERLVHQRENPSWPDRAVLDLLGDVVRLLEWLSREDPHDARRRATYVGIDLTVAVLRGIVDDDVFGRGVDAIDGENYREWLARHGASETTLSSSAPQAYPNIMLAYAYGDTTAIPTMSAAAYVTWFLRQVLGKGSGSYFFAEGTGETVMKPLFRLLRQRGVRFHFFHKLAAVVPHAEQPLIDALELDVQATVRGDTYEPLRRLDGAGELVWPDRPNYEQLVEGEALRRGGYDLESWWTPWKAVGQRTLRRGDDFDYVVLATPIATLEHTCPRLIDHPAGRAAWGPMVKNIKSAASQAVQIWINTPTASLGWDAPKGPTDRYVGCLYGQDLTTFCDFSDLIAHEGWPANNRPRGLLYFIGVLADPDEIPAFDDHDYPVRERERVKWSAVQFLRNIDGLLPGAARSPIDPRSFDFDLLVAPDPTRRGRGVNQFAQQYYRANIDPNERYTLSLEGTVQHRLEAWDSKFDNLVLAGDWIYTGLNLGSFEGAVMSGKLASLALTGAPSLDHIYGYAFLHPERGGPARIRLVDH